MRHQIYKVLVALIQLNNTQVLFLMIDPIKQVD